MIEIVGLRKRFGSVTVLDGIDHHQEAGEVVALIGPSGCGKSTLLRCLNWLETPDSGSLHLGDVRIEAGTPQATDRALRQRLRRRTGMIFQQFNLFPHRTALENVMEAPLHVDRVPDAEAREQAMDLLSKVGLADRAHHRPSQLSGGQQQRVAIARALAMKPQILLCDEPTSALDPELRGEVLSVLARLADEGMTLLLVTHELNFARDIAHRVVFIDGGRVVATGPTRAVLDQPEHPRLREFLGLGRRTAIA
ncbi:MAG: amino acid ABC transporter ATP-binding protein [Verrucomicrobiota bacterium]|nr:amino acid ABC transporter ATP-binding protein [Verrucomicrobiota bacterium]